MRACPFCGFEEGWSKEVPNRTPITYVVECAVCGAVGPEAKSYEMAEKKWDGILSDIEDDKEFQKVLKEQAMGGVSSPMSTPNNTPGMGNPSPGTTTSFGSGDKWGSSIGNKMYTQAKSIRSKKSKSKKRRVKKEVNEKFIENSDPIKDMGIGLKKWYDQQVEDFMTDLSDKLGSAMDIYLPSGRRVDLYNLVKQGYKVKTIPWSDNDDNGNEHPSRQWKEKHLKKYLDGDWEKFWYEYNMSSAEYILVKPPKEKLSEENVNPYDKIGVMMAKKMKTKLPFKKKKEKGNQNAMKQQKFEHEIVPFEEYKNLNESNPLNIPSEINAINEFKNLFREKYPYIGYDVSDKEAEKFLSQKHIYLLPVNKAVDLFADYVLSQGLADDVQE